MPNLYAQLHRRYGKKDGLTRREMIQRSLAAAGALLISDRIGVRDAAGKRRAGRRHRRRLQRSGGRVRADAGGLRRDRRRSAQPRRRARDQLLRHRPGQERRRGRRADRLEPSDVGRHTRSSSSSISSTSAKRTLEFPIVLNGKRLTADESEALWEEMEKAFAPLLADAAKIDADRPWTATERRGARQTHARPTGSRGSASRRLCKAGTRTR